MKKIIAAIFLSLSLMLPMIASADYPAENRNDLHEILMILEQKLEVLKQLLNFSDQAPKNNATALIIKQLHPVAEIQSNNCNNYDKICGISHFGTRKEPPFEYPTSTVPQFILKYTDAIANIANIDYSISDIQNNQTTYWIDYGMSSSTLDSATPPMIISYGIDNAHGIGDANSLISIPGDLACSYGSSTATLSLGPLYLANPPLYYFRFEARNNLGTFFTPSLNLPPFSFQFDNMCGEQIHHYWNGSPFD